MEENLYDTSVMIDSVRRGLKELRGCTTIFNLIEFPKAVELEGLKVLYPTMRDCDEALKLSVRLLRLGKPIPAIDILIASMATLRGLKLVTKDEHFKDLLSMRIGLKIEFRGK